MRRKTTEKKLGTEGRMKGREMEEEERKSESHCSLIGVKKRGGMETGNQLLGLDFALALFAVRLNLEVECVKGKKQ